MSATLTTALLLDHVMVPVPNRFGTKVTVRLDNCRPAVTVQLQMKLFSSVKVDMWPCQHNVPDSIAWQSVASSCSAVQLISMQQGQGREDCSTVVAKVSLAHKQGQGPSGA